ncbi:MAG TPA: hypothetical protein VH476_09705 [Solirubrobacterales bacterium]
MRSAITVVVLAIAALASAPVVHAKVPPRAHPKVPDACKVLTPLRAESFIDGVVGKVDPIRVPSDCPYTDEKPAPESVASIDFNIMFHRGTEQKAHQLWKKFRDELGEGEGTTEGLHGFGADDSVGYEYEFETASPPKVSTTIWWRKGKWVGSLQATSTVKSNDASLQYMPHLLKLLMHDFSKAFG